MTSEQEDARAACAAVEETVREQLREAWQRGLDTAPHGVNALADAGAPDAFDAIMTKVNWYAAHVAAYWRDRVPAPGKQAGG